MKYFGVVFTKEDINVILGAYKDILHTIKCWEEDAISFKDIIDATPTTDKYTITTGRNILTFSLDIKIGEQYIPLFDCECDSETDEKTAKELAEEKYDKEIYIEYAEEDISDWKERYSQLKDQQIGILDDWEDSQKAAREESQYIQSKAREGGY